MRTNPCQPPTIQTTTLQTTHIGFDSTGNLDTVQVGTHDTTATVSPGNRLATWTGLTFAGDSDGNRTSVAGATAKQYTWSADGRLLSVTSGSTTRTYDYNAFGQVVRRSTNGSVDQYYLWDGSQLLAILGPSATSRTAEFVYYPDGVDEPMARITGSTGQSIVHLMAQDGTGNIIGEYGPDSTLDQWLSYDPWGMPSVSTLTNDTTQLRWKGLLYEGGATSLYYMRARWYDPATRRFISPDPLGLAAGVNQFAFAGGDPINGRDPLGLDPCSDDPGPIPIVNIPTVDIGDPGDPGGGDPTIADCVVYNDPGGGGFSSGGGGGGGGGGGQPPKPQVRKHFGRTTPCTSTSSQVMTAVEGNFPQFGNYSFGPLSVTFSPTGPLSPGSTIPIRVGVWPFAQHMAVQVTAMSSQSMTFITLPGDHLLYPATVTFAASSASTSSINFNIDLSGNFNGLTNATKYYSGAALFENAQWNSFLGKVQAFCKAGR